MQAGKQAQGDEGLEFRLTVWRTPGSGWHARVVSSDAATREFASPLELARYFAWVGGELAAANPAKGLR